MEYMHELTESAKLIGAVNTVIPLGDGKFRGDNTDWLGIKNSLTRNGVPEKASGVAGLVIGAGGTSRAAIYALYKLGCSKIYMVNRTPSKLFELQKNFPAEYNIEVLESVEQVEAVKEAVGIAVSCIPADKPLDAGLMSLLERALNKGGESNFAPTLLDAAYKPSTTPVMKLAHDKYQWQVIPGAQMLVHQGVAQFERWTGFRAPFAGIFNAVTQE